MSNVEQWEPDELRAMDNEIISLREQVEKWKSLHESLTKLNEAQERRHEKQVEKLTKERDEAVAAVQFCIDNPLSDPYCLSEMLRARAAELEKTNG